MEKTVAIGIQNFGDLIKGNVFYIDKTYFIKEWWENKDDVTLITRPRRFGKTLTMSMLEHFFSLRYVEGGQIFEGLSVWKEEHQLMSRGVSHIRKYGFAFQGKKVLIG